MPPWQSDISTASHTNVWKVVVTHQIVLIAFVLAGSGLALLIAQIVIDTSQNERYQAPSDRIVTAMSAATWSHGVPMETQEERSLINRKVTNSQTETEEAKPRTAIPQAVRLSVPNHKQERNLNCEFRSAADLAAYYDVTITWKQLFLSVGHDPTGDPSVGFVGRSIDDPSGGIYPDGYGVHAGPVADGLRALDVPAHAHDGQTIEWLKKRVAAGHPVMVWATADMRHSQVVEWETKTGDIAWGVPWEHTFLVVGYDEAGVWVNDPYQATTDHYSWQTFQRAWNLFNNMALSIDKNPPVVQQ